MQRILTINAGGRRFTTYLSTLIRFPETKFAHLINKLLSKESVLKNKCNANEQQVFDNNKEEELFLDVNPEAFEYILHFMRTSQLQLPKTNELVRNQIIQYLDKWDLLSHAVSPLENEVHDNQELRESHLINSLYPEGDKQLKNNLENNYEDNRYLNNLSRKQTMKNVQVEKESKSFNNLEHLSSKSNLITLPNVCVVQLSDHLHHDQGMKRHAMTISYGSDGFHLRQLCQQIRRDLNLQLSSTYWQCYQTGERALFFTTTKIANGAADLMTASILQQIITHTENFGYELRSSYITLSPDVMHTSVRLLLHNFIFRRIKNENIELSELQSLQSSDNDFSELFTNLSKGNYYTEKIDNNELAKQHVKEKSEEEWMNEHANNEIETFNNFESRLIGPQKEQ